jgi:ABC-2 type transport system permease protein
MTLCDYRLRDQGTWLGLAWTLLNPFLMYFALHTLFSGWFAHLVPNFSDQLLIGILQWNFFSIATTAAVSSFEKKRQLINHFPMQKWIIVASTILTIYLSSCIEHGLLVAYLRWKGTLVVSGVPGFFALSLFHLLLVSGVALILACLQVFFRDVGYVWAACLKIGFLVTPIIFPAEAVSADRMWLLTWNPLHHLFRLVRQSLLSGTLPLDGSAWYLAGCLLLVFALAVPLFLFTAESFAECL